MSETHRRIGGLGALIGAWVFVSAFAFGMVGAHFWNDLIVGAGIFVLAGYSAAKADTSRTGDAWASGLAGLLGLWMIASPFVYGASTSAMWSSVVSGVLVAVLSGYNAYEASESAEPAAPEQTRA